MVSQKVEELMNWKGIFQKIGRLRVIAGYIFVFVFFIFSKPDFSLLYLALPLIFFGIFLRTWSAGCITKKKELATRGPYSITRHPLYFGSFLIGFGFTILGGIKWTFLFLIGFFIFYIPKIIVEEDWLRNAYGEEYERYRKEVPLFFPRTFRFRKGGFRWERVKNNREYYLWLGALLFFGFYYLKGKLFL